MSKRNPRAKWVLPSVVDPPRRICFQIQVPDERYHIAAFLGALYNLTSAIFWSDDNLHTAKRVASVWQDIYDNISRQCVTEFINTYVGLEDNMPFFRQVCENDICYLEFECCPGEWIRLGRADKIPTGAQPGEGSPQPPPGGGTADYCATLQANNKLYIPTPVSAGDTITIQASGAGNDGGEIQWRCPDGSTFFAGNCNASEMRLDGADPVPSAKHMSLIINLDSTFYTFSSGSFTVPGGISNAQAYIQVNDSDITNNVGSYQICVTITNNQAAVWSHTFDFTLSDGGWIPSAYDLGAPSAAWSAGVGWIATNVSVSGSPNRQCEINLSKVIPNLTSIELVGNYTYGGLSSGEKYVKITVNGTDEFDVVVPASYPDGTKDHVVPLSISSVTTIQCFFQNCTGSLCVSGDSKITSVKLSGTGTNPF